MQHTRVWPQLPRPSLRAHCTAARQHQTLTVILEGCRRYELRYFAEVEGADVAAAFWNSSETAAELPPACCNGMRMGQHHRTWMRASAFMPAACCKARYQTR